MLSRKDVEIAMIALDLFWGELYDEPDDLIAAVLPEGVTKDQALMVVRQVFNNMRTFAGELEEESLLDTHNRSIKKDLFSME